MDIEEYKDLPKKYEKTFFQFKAKEEKEWKTCYAESIKVYLLDEEDIPLKNPWYKVKVVFGEFSSKTCIKSLKYDFKFDIPPIGVLNYKDTVVIATRFPARQWKKAATPENYNVHFPLKNLFKGLEQKYVLPNTFITNFDFNIHDIDILYKNKYYSFKEACQELKKGKVNATAISPEFFLTNSFYNNTTLLWRFNTIVAEISRGTIKYLLPVIEQEVKDFFKRNSICLT